MDVNAYSIWEKERNRMVSVLINSIKNTTRWVDFVDIIEAIQHIQYHAEQHIKEEEILHVGYGERKDV